MNIEDEIKIIHDAKKNPEAFSPLFRIYYPQIFNYVARRVGGVEMAEDIVAETFFKAVKNLWQFQWRGIPFSSWLYRLAGNEVKKYYRRNKYSSFSLEKMCEEGIIEPADSSDLVEEICEAEAIFQKHTDFLKIQKLLRSLPCKYQEVISLRFFEDKKIREIAEILGKKQGTIKSCLSRGIALLRNKML